MEEIVSQHNFFLSLVTMQRQCKAYYELCSSFCDITLSDMFLGDASYYVCENIFERRKLTRSCFSPTNNFGEFWSIKNSFLDKKIIEIILCRWIKSLIANSNSKNIGKKHLALHLRYLLDSWIVTAFLSDKKFNMINL